MRQKIISLKATSKEVEIRQMHNYCWCALLYYLRFKQYKLANEVKQMYTTYFIYNQISFRKDFKIYIETLCGITCFFSNQYKECIQWLLKYVNNPIPHIEINTQAYLRIFILLVHYEEKDFDAFMYCLKEAKKYFKLHNLLMYEEDMFLQFLEKSMKHQLTKSKQTNRYKDILVELTNKLENNSCKVLNIHILHWLESKVHA